MPPVYPIILPFGARWVYGQRLDSHRLDLGFSGNWGCFSDPLFQSRGCHQKLWSDGSRIARSGFSGQSVFFSQQRNSVQTHLHRRWLLGYFGSSRPLHFAQPLNLSYASRHFLPRTISSRWSSHRSYQHPSYLQTLQRSALVVRPS